MKLRSTRHMEPCSSSVALNACEFKSAAQLRQWPHLSLGVPVDTAGISSEVQLLISQVSGSA